MNYIVTDTSLLMWQISVYWCSKNKTLCMQSYSGWEKLWLRNFQYTENKAVHLSHCAEENILPLFINLDTLRYYCFWPSVSGNFY